MRTVIALYRLMREKHPPGWAWALAAFAGIVLADLVANTAYGATVASTEGDHFPGLVVALVCLAIAFLLVLALVAKTMFSGEQDPYEPDAMQQRLDAMCQVRPHHQRVVRMADRRGDSSQPGQHTRW